MNASSPTRPLLKLLTTALLAAGLLAGCAGGAEKVGDVKSGAATGDAVEIEAGDNFFKPEVLQLKSGDEITVEITNTGDAAHDWTVDELKVSTGTMSAGDIANATFIVPDKDMKFVCTLHSGMEGMIKVD